MKNQLNYSEFIERYLDGEMGEQELIWFEKELEANSWLQNEVSMRKKIDKAISEKKLMQYRAQLDEVSAAYEKTEKRAPVRKMPVVAGSVLASILVGVLILLFFTGRQYTNEQLFNKFYQSYDATMSFRSAEDNLNSDLAIAMQKYEEGNFRGALVLFEKILRTDPSRIGLEFYSGMSHFEIKEYENANKSFQKVIDNKFNMYIEQAEWYLGLCYLVTNDIKNAKKQFEKIANSNGFYSAKAKKIARQLK
jgi:tetratricopeptide (TPR) repeat protein